MGKNSYMKKEKKKEKGRKKRETFKLVNHFAANWANYYESEQIDSLVIVFVKRQVTMS